MKKIHRFLLGLVLLIGLSSTQSAKAYYYYAAVGYCPQSPQFGAIARSCNYATYTGAVNRVRNILYSYGATYVAWRWHNYTGYSGIGRGYSNYYSSYVYFRWAWGWSTYTGAYNSIHNGLYYYPYYRSILIGYNY